MHILHLPGALNSGRPRPLSFAYLVLSLIMSSLPYSSSRSGVPTNATGFVDLPALRTLPEFRAHLAAWESSLSNHVTVLETPVAPEDALPIREDALSSTTGDILVRMSSLRLPMIFRLLV